MTIRRMLAVSALLVMAGNSAQAATLYDCRGKPSAKNPDKSTLAIAVLDKSGQAIGMDAWSHDKQNPDQFWPAEVKRNDAEVLDLRWNTDRQRSRQGTYASLRITLRIKKADMSFLLALTGPDIREQNLTGTCVKVPVKDFDS